MPLDKDALDFQTPQQASSRFRRAAAWSGSSHEKTYRDAATPPSPARHPDELHASRSGNPFGCRCLSFSSSSRLSGTLTSTSPVPPKEQPNSSAIDSLESAPNRGSPPLLGAVSAVPLPQFWRRWLRPFALPGYDRRYLAVDLIAGITSGVAAVPLGMSYATLAGMPAENGLYAQFFYSLLYMLLGRGRQVVVGANAVEAVLSAAAVARILEWDSPAELWIQTSSTLAFLVGIALLILAAARFGTIAELLPDAVIAGFSSGCSIVIASTQIKYVLNIPDQLPRNASTLETWIYAIQNIASTDRLCLLITAVVLAIYTGVHFVNRFKCFRRFPIPAVVVGCGAAIAATWKLGLHLTPHNVPIFGDISAGFPMPVLPLPRRLWCTASATATSPNPLPNIILALCTQAAFYALIYSLIHVSVARGVANRGGFTLNANREIFAVGVAGAVGSLFGCFSIATAPARTSLVEVTGAKSTLFNLSNVLTIAISLLWFTRILYYLPNAALAATVLFGAFWMFRPSEARHMLERKHWGGFVVWSLVFASTIFQGPAQGILAGVVITLLWRGSCCGWAALAPILRVCGRGSPGCHWLSADTISSAVEPTSIALPNVADMGLKGSHCRSGSLATPIGAQQQQACLKRSGAARRTLEAGDNSTACDCCCCSNSYCHCCSPSQHSIAGAINAVAAG